MSFKILLERPHHAPLIDPLLDLTFGPERTARTVYRLRENITPLPGLCFVAVDARGGLLASLRFWPILIGEAPAILLGPLAVQPEIQGRGVGRNLVRYGLGEGRRLGHRLCIVVGEPEYYVPYGFINAAAAGLILPGPVDPRRFQVLELITGAVEGLRGMIARDEVTTRGLDGSGRGLRGALA